MPIPTETPIPETPTPIIPTETPAPSPTPLTLGVVLEMPSHYFRPGDLCYLYAYVHNPLEHLDANLFVILDINTGDYWFWPGWVHYPPDYSYMPISLPYGIYSYEVLPEFVFPYVSYSMNNLKFWGALTDPEITRIIGEYDIWQFGFGP